MVLRVNDELSFSATAATARHIVMLQNAPVGNGVQLTYIDSGPPSDTPYTTIVIVHGHSYHARNFARLIPRAPAHNLRVIALNRRAYPGSTPLGPADLALLDNTDDEKHTAFLRARGEEIAIFLVWAIENLKVSPAGLSGGGIALVGWSLGTAITLAFLRHLPEYAPAIIDALEPYLKTFFIYESAYATLGYPAPPSGYHPFQDTDIADLPAPARSEAFTAWLASYFSHPCYAANPPQRLSLSLLQLRSPAPSESETFHPPSHTNINPPAFAASADSVAGEHAEKAFYGAVRGQTLKDQLIGAICGAPNTAQPPPLPHLRLVHVTCTRSLWTIQWGTWAFRAELARWEDQEGTERRVRPVEFVQIEGANHFWHWDDPDAFLALVSDKAQSREEV
ncbi:alpha/beta-hydrolase [Phellopilus nigrolimitatus]|nr:alpha/beta-hydrolase [Phellopilus nigrolimitatus]